MTQIFTGSGLGLTGSSLEQLGAYGPRGSAPLGQGSQSVYVNAATGNLVLHQADGFLAGLGLGLELLQSYNSRGEGSGWRFNVQTSLRVKGRVNAPGSEVTRIDEDGHCTRFVFDASKKAYLSADGRPVSLSFQGKHWLYREGGSARAYEYNEVGLLVAIKDRDGHSFQLYYREGQLVSIVDSSGKQRIEWLFQGGLLQEVNTYSEGQVVHHLQYSYDGQGRLLKFSRDLGGGKTYWVTYDYAGDSNRISGLHQSDGTALFFDYDGEGRLKSLVDGEGRTSLYEYLGDRTILRNSLGESWTYVYNQEGRLTRLISSNAAPIDYIYEGAHLAAIQRGSLHWAFAYNDQGDCIRVEEPSGQVTLRRYDEEHRLLAETSYQAFDGNHYPSQPQTNHFVYDEQGHLRFKFEASGRIIEYRYNEQGLLKSSRSYQGSGFSWFLESEPGLAELAAWAEGHRAQTTNLVGYLYDWRGLLAEEVHYGALDAQGQGLSEQALVTRYCYDAAGRLLEKSVPTAEGWSTSHYLYDDLGRLLQKTDNQGHYECFDYDDAHQRVIATDAKGVQTIRTYDRSGLLLASQIIDSKQQDYGSTLYHYDAAGRLQAERSADGKWQYYFYDEAGRLSAKCGLGGQVTEYRYDLEGRLVQTLLRAEPVNTEAWQVSQPVWEVIRSKSNVRDRISQSIYNSYNQLAYQIDAEGRVIAFDYDAKGQVIQKTAYATRLRAYQAQQILTFEQVRLQASVDDRSLFFRYDQEGHLIAEVNGEGAVTAYRYNGEGHLVETRRYAKRLDSPVTADWALPAASRQDIRQFSLFNAAGLKVTDIDPLGYATCYRYDARGLLLEKRRFSQQIDLAGLNEMSGLADLGLQESEMDWVTAYLYDDLGLLLEELAHNGLITRYRYDERGAVLEKIMLDAKTQARREQHYRYDALGRVIQELDALGGALLAQPSFLSEEQIEAIWQQHSLRYDYDKAGRLLSQTNALNQQTRYFYDEAGLLVYTVNAEGEVSEQSYNLFGQVTQSYRYSKHLSKGLLSGLTIGELTSHLAVLRDEVQDERINYEYNSLGLLIKKTVGRRGELVTHYNAFGEVEETIQRIDATRSLTTAYRYDRRGLLRHRIDDVGGVNRDNEIQYDVFGRIKAQFDGYGRMTRTFSYDLRSNLINIYDTSDPAGIQVKWLKYDAFNRQISETLMGGSVVVKTYVYDDVRRTLTINHLHGNKTNSVVTCFNAFGDKLSVNEANGNTTADTYNAKGQLLQVDTPEGQYTSYHYDEAGNLIWQEDAAGQSIQYVYDAAGRVLSKTIDAQGLALKTSYHYDAIGRQLEVIEANGLCKRFHYDSAGNLLQTVIDPEGLNLTTEFRYDERGQLIEQRELNAAGQHRVTAYEMDILGRCTVKILDPEGLRLATRFAYDKNDNLISQTDARGYTTQFVYDANNRCRYQVDARGVVTEHLYSANGYEFSTIIYSKRLPPLEDYSLASLKAAIQPDAQDQQQFRLFDSEGRVTLSYDSLGYATQYLYDGNGNLIEVIRSAQASDLAALKAGARPLPSQHGSRKKRFAYDALNRLCYEIEENNVTAYRYDKAGRLQSKTRYARTLFLSGIDWSREAITAALRSSPQDQCTRYAYDKAGRLTFELSAGGFATAYRYDGLGQKIETLHYAKSLNTAVINEDNWQALLSESKEDRLTRAVFDAAGRERYRISAEGRVLERCYDALGNILAEIAYSLQIERKAFTLAELDKTFEQNTQARSTSYAYDQLGRLLTKTDAKAQQTHYSYDSNNNVLAKTEANQAEWRYVYDEANKLIETHSPKISVAVMQAGQWRSEERSIITKQSYDSFGNLIEIINDAEGLAQRRYFVYDQGNRKIQTIYPDVLVNAANIVVASRQEVAQTLSETLKYNAFGEVIASKDRAGIWRYQAYDGKGQLLFSLDGSRALTAYRYDAFGNVEKKIRYSTPLTVDEASEYSAEDLQKAHRDSKNDRQEYYFYDLDNRLMMFQQREIRTYNGKTKRYELLRPTTSYEYNAFGELMSTSVRRNEVDSAVTRYYYDRDGLKIAALDAESYLTSYTYNAFGEVSEESQYAERAHLKADLSFTSPRASAQDRRLTFSYDALGQLTSKTLKGVKYQTLVEDRNAYKDVVGDLTTSYTYDALGNLTSITDVLGYSSYCYYDKLGQLIAKVGPATQAGRAAVSYGYNALGQLVETTRFAKGAAFADETHYQFVEASTEDRIVRSIYDDEGRLLVEIDGLNHETYYSYDANGQVARRWQLLSQVDGSQKLIDKRYRYDSEGRLEQTETLNTDGQSHTEDAAYNVFGEVIAKGVNGRLTTHVDYDSLGRVWRSNTEGSYQIYVYDLGGHVTQVISSTNAFRPQHGDRGVDLSQIGDNSISFDKDTFLYDLQRYDNIYDGLGHLVKQVKEFAINGTNDGNPSLKVVTQSQTVDRWGNILIHRDARNFETRYSYNVFDQAIEQVLPEVMAYNQQGKGTLSNPKIYYAYDALGRAIALMDANHHTVAKILDAQGQVLQEIDAKGNRRIKTYNLFGELSASQNELGVLTSYHYDQNNRLISVTGKYRSQSYHYDEAGQLIQQSDQLKQTIDFWYDSLGNLVRKRDINQRETVYAYDAAGHKVYERDNNQNVQSWTYEEETGHLINHIDLGGHVTNYRYNSNGLLVEETSTAGKHLQYHYQGDGELIQFADLPHGEVVDYAYDEAGNVIAKTASRVIQGNDGWLRENDVYEYDALGRLVSLRRRRPDDKDPSAPARDRALLNVDYQYDEVGNILHTQVSANYSGVARVLSDEYYSYDENNRMLISKGVLVNGEISLTTSQGSRLDYDAAGNLISASNYEGGRLQNYDYKFDDGLVQAVYKNGQLLRKSEYDALGRLQLDYLYDSQANAAQKTEFIYKGDLLVWQITRNARDLEQQKSENLYDGVGNLISTTSKQYDKQGRFYRQDTHEYTYVLWDGYQQSRDSATTLFSNNQITYGSSIREYDINGLLQRSIDYNVDAKGQNNSVNYKVSAHEGIRAKQDKNGQTSYLTVAGKTIGDLKLDHSGNQKLNVYGGFTPVGTAPAAPRQPYHWAKASLVGASMSNFFLGASAPQNSTANTEAILANTPVDVVNAYQVQAGDSLDSIALQVYGDKSLWYLIAEANGLTERSNGLHCGQRLVIPPAAASHHTSSTHKVMNTYEVIGDTSATTPAPPPPPSPPVAEPKRKKHSLFKKIVASVVSVIATCLAAAATAALFGLPGASLVGGLKTILAYGAQVLAGQTTASMAGTLATGLVAGFAGSLASQGVAKAFGLQDKMDFKSALGSGLATAASAGLLHGLSGSDTYGKFAEGLDKFSPKGFSLSSAALLMEQDALSQGVALTLNKHQHFNWAEFGAKGALGGMLGSEPVKNASASMDKKFGDGASSFLKSQLGALGSAGMQAAATGTHFDAGQVLADNLGTALGGAIIDGAMSLSQNDFALQDELYLTDTILDAIHPERTEEAVMDNYFLEQATRAAIASAEGQYCPIPEEENYSAIPDGFYEHANKRRIYDSFTGENDEVRYNNEPQKTLKWKEEQSSFPTLETISDYLTHANNTQLFARAGIAQYNGFRAESIIDPKTGLPTGKVRILGAQYANKVVGLPANFRYSTITNPRLLWAKGLTTSFNPIQNFRPTTIGGVFNIAGLGVDVANVSYKFYENKINDSQYAGELGNIATKAVFTTGVTATTSYFAIAGFGAIAVAELPILVTVGAAIGIGYGAQKAYDRVSPLVKTSYEKAYNWTKSKFFY